MSKRVCPEPGCPTLTNGGPCQQHRRESPTYLVRDKAERNRRALTVAAWIAEHGWTCPGWQRPAHPSRDLTAAHTIAVALGGAHSPLTSAGRPGSLWGHGLPLNMPLTRGYALRAVA